MSFLTLKGAYGREYFSIADAIKDWEEGLEFVISTPIIGGKFVNRDRAEDLIFIGYPILCFTEAHGRALGYYSLRREAQIPPGALEDERREWIKDLGPSGWSNILDSPNPASHDAPAHVRREERRAPTRPSGAGSQHDTSEGRGDQPQFCRRVHDRRS